MLLRIAVRFANLAGSITSLPQSALVNENLRLRIGLVQMCYSWEE